VLLGRSILLRRSRRGAHAFTNDIAQLVICYRHGLRALRRARAHQAARDLRLFEMGPLEWAWRALTYWHKPPMRRRDADPARGDNMSAATG
jgi:hypothetical protein